MTRKWRGRICPPCSIEGSGRTLKRVLCVEGEEIMLDMHHDFMRVGECKLSCEMSSRGARNLEGHIMQTVMHHATIFRASVLV